MAKTGGEAQAEPRNDGPAIASAIMDAVKGRKTFGEILGINAGQAYNLAQLGYRLLQEGQLEDARVMFQGLVTLNPKDPYMHLALGSVHHRAGRAEEAIAEYSKAIELDPQLTNAYANRGELYLGSHQAEKGINDLKKAIELDPKAEDPSTMRARAIIATTAAKLKEKSDAKAGAKPAAGAAAPKKK
ncbi:MAG TPA: tetratricopeptide repeat protein [Planctomycetota bacterium]|nr:tetratricopeptide repeat protein [Planctomycetota bacterium]